MKAQRLEDVATFINKHKQASLDDLTNQFNVSLNTIRRDLTILEKEARIKKVYGGAVANNSTQELLPSTLRRGHFIHEKKNIAKRIANSIQSRDTIFIDSGTTTSFILDNINHQLPFTLLTNNLDVMTAAAVFPNADLIVIGTDYIREIRAFVNNSAPTLEHLNIDKAFMSATGVDEDGQVTNSNLAEYKIKKRVMSHSNEKYLLVDSSKFQKTALLTYATLTEFDAVVTTTCLSQISHTDAVALIACD